MKHYVCAVAPTASRRTFLKGGLAAATLSATGVWLPESAVAAETPFIPYAADSLFRKPVTGAPVDGAATTSFKSFMRSHPDQKAFSWPKITGTGSNQWGTTFHLSKPGDPVWKISAGTRSETAILANQGFHENHRVLEQAVGIDIGQQTGHGVLSSRSKQPNRSA